MDCFNRDTNGNGRLLKMKLVEDMWIGSQICFCKVTGVCVAFILLGAVGIVGESYEHLDLPNNGADLQERQKFVL